MPLRDVPVIIRMIVTVSDIAMVEKYAQPFSDDAKALMAKFWPGSLTMIFKLKPNALSKAVTGGSDTAAFRFPKKPSHAGLISKAGVPIVGPSANTSGKAEVQRLHNTFIMI